MARRETERYNIFSEAHGTRVPAATEVEGPEVMEYAKALRKAGNIPVVYSVRDGVRIFV